MKECFREDEQKLFREHERGLATKLSPCGSHVIVSGPSTYATRRLWNWEGSGWSRDDKIGRVYERGVGWIIPIGHIKRLHQGYIKSWLMRSMESVRQTTQAQAGEFKQRLETRMKHHAQDIKGSLVSARWWRAWDGEWGGEYGAQNTGARGVARRSEELERLRTPYPGTPVWMGIGHCSGVLDEVVHDRTMWPRDDINGPCRHASHCQDLWHWLWCLGKYLMERQQLAPVRSRHASGNRMPLMQATFDCDRHIDKFERLWDTIYSLWRDCQSRQDTDGAHVFWGLRELVVTLKERVGGVEWSNLSSIYIDWIMKEACDKGAWCEPETERGCASSRWVRTEVYVILSALQMMWRREDDTARFLRSIKDWIWGPLVEDSWPVRAVSPPPNAEEKEQEVVALSDDDGEAEELPDDLLECDMWAEARAKAGATGMRGVKRERSD